MRLDKLSTQFISMNTLKADYPCKLKLKHEYFFTIMLKYDSYVKNK